MAVIAGGIGCFTAIVFGVVLLVAIVIAALGNVLPQPLHDQFWGWVLTGVPASSDAVLPIGSTHIPFAGYQGPTSFVCKIPPQSRYAALTDCFGTPRRWGYHHGIDIGTPMNSPVITPMGGEVVYAAYSPVGYGNLVVIENDGYQVLLAHNTKLLVHVGEIVTAGQVVAYSGSTGASTGPHVHFEVRRVDRKGAVAIDPPQAMLPGQVAPCDWYHLVPANDHETHGCENYH